MKNKILIILILVTIISFGTILQSIPSYAALEDIEYHDPDRDGYIIPGTRFKRGEILFISNDEIEITTKQGREKYRITDETFLLKRDISISINQVKEGDKVFLAFNNIYTTEVSSIKIEDEERIISGILRGKIELVDERNKEIWIKTPSIYKEGKFIPSVKHNIKLKTTGINLYNGSQKIPFRNLKYFRGKEVYIAYDESFGRMNIAKLTIRNGLGEIHEGLVSNIQYTTGQVIMNNNLMHLSEGSIVIKDNRLVDNLNIDRNHNLVITTNTVLGRRNISLATMTTNPLDNRLDKTKITIYRGKIEDIFEYEIEIGKLNYRLESLVLKDQKWEEVKENRRFTLSEDTLIYDSELKELIDPYYLISSRFINITDIRNLTLRERLKGNYYKNKQAYFVVREGEYGNELLALNLIPDQQFYSHNVKLNHSIMGEIKEIDQENNKITMTKVKNYNTLNNSWEATIDETIDLSKAVILLNDAPIPLDNLYILREGQKVYSIKEKKSSIDEGYILLIED